MGSGMAVEKVADVIIDTERDRTLYPFVPDADLVKLNDDADTGFGSGSGLGGVIRDQVGPKPGELQQEPVIDGLTIAVDAPNNGDVTLQDGQYTLDAGAANEVRSLIDAGDLEGASAVLREGLGLQGDAGGTWSYEFTQTESGPRFTLTNSYSDLMRPWAARATAMNMCLI